MYKIRHLSASSCFVLRSLLSSAKCKDIFVPQRFFFKQPIRKKSYPKILKHLFSTGIVCSAAVYYLKDFKQLTLNSFTVNAIDKPSQPYNFLADVIEKAQPAVVYIEVTMRHPYGNAIVQSNGSGFIVREDGLILTNAHVVGQQTKVKVKLQDGRILTGQVQAVDPVTDLATVKVNGNNLPTLKLGNSSASRAGEFVVAMGSPLRLSNTVTHGIISSVHRGSDELGMHHRDMDYIQTDAVITKGNSGGPLVNMKGEAIGINTLNVMSGISFSIPSDKAIEFLEKAKSFEKKNSSKSWLGFGKSTKPKHYIGITMFTLTPDILSELEARIPDFPRNISNGVLIHSVMYGSPAYRAGVEPADVIIKINNVDAKTSNDVHDQIMENDKVVLEIIRKNERLTITIEPDIVE